MNIKEVLKIVCERDASDLLLKVNNVPYLRLYGELIPLNDFPAMTVGDMEQIIAEITDDVHAKILREIFDTDFGIDVEGLDRFRVSIFFQRNVPSIVMRRIKKHVPDFEELNLRPDVFKMLSQEKRGLVLVTGPAGSGKSSTIASMINYMNNNFSRHIITLENPIEFTFDDKKSVINQRELDLDVTSYPMALRQVTLQSPDVVFIGTICDHDTMFAALNAAEMGVLVLGTIHTVNAAQTAQRIINFFPPHQHAEVRMQLSFLLRGVVSQRLVPNAEGFGRVPACETMILTPTISRLIREGALADITRFLEEGSLFGMESFKQSLARLVRERKITVEEAYKYADSKDELGLEIKGIKRLI